MILIFKGQYGSTIDLHAYREIQGFEFVNPPIEFRFVRGGLPISNWRPPAPGYVSLLHPVVAGPNVRTQGLDATNLAVETRGLGETFTLLVWPRE